MFRTPPITKNLIIINVLMFFALMVGERWGIDLNDLLGLHFMKAPDFHLYQLVTYMFMHANVTHIFFNLFMFWMFGRTMENVWGPRRFLLFYLVCGLGAGVLQEAVQLCTYYWDGLDQYQLVNMGSGTLPMGDYLNRWTTVGASGAIYGILLGFGMTFPNERIMLLIPPIPIKAKYMVLASIVIELLLGMGASGDNVAHFAHLGGMLFGWFLIRHWRKQDAAPRNGFTSWSEYKPQRKSFLSRMIDKIKNLFTKQTSANHNYTDFEEDQTSDDSRHKASQEELNRILEKIKRSGYESLTTEEKRKLFDAGKK